MNVILILIILGFVIMLPYFIQSFSLILKERQKETFIVEYITGYDKDVTEDYLKTKKRIVYIKLENKFTPNNDNELLNKATKIIKDRHPYFMNVRDLKITPISVIGDKISNFQFKF